MRSPGRRVGAVILWLLVPLAGCADSDVVFPPGDPGSDGATEAGRDTSVDAPADFSVVPDVGVDTTDQPEARVDTAAPDTPPPDAPADTTTSDVAPDAGSDVVEEPGQDDGSRDAVSEEAGTCGSHCASGVCDVNGDCKPCVKDEECTGGRVCGSGVCAPRCGDGGVACTGTSVCCSEHCVDTTRDPQHCGSCGMTCPATQFCGNASTPACKDNLLRNLCNTKKATFLLAGLVDDDASSNVLKAAIAARCLPTPVLTSVFQTISSVINTTTGQPVAGGGELLVSAGGDSTQLLTRYLESSRTSTVYNESDGVLLLQFKHRGGATDGGDSVITTVALSSITPTHDFFLTEVVKDPVSGTFSLIVYGIESQGTRAGAYHFANVILPDIVGADVPSFTQAWYVYEWTGVNPDGGPGPGDTFTLVDSGL